MTSTNQSLYLVTVIAFKPDPLLTRWVDKVTGKVCLFYDGDVDALSCVDLWPETRVRSELVRADSEGEAAEALLRKVKDSLPEDEGWIYEKGCSLCVDDEMHRRSFCRDEGSREDDEIVM